MLRSPVERHHFARLARADDFAHPVGPLLQRIAALGQEFIFVVNPDQSRRGVADNVLGDLSAYPEPRQPRSTGPAKIVDSPFLVEFQLPVQLDLSLR